MQVGDVSIIFCSFFDPFQEQIAQLENKRKQLIQEQKTQERKDRTKRLCRRMGLFESLLPDTIPLSDELFKTFLEKVLSSDSARRILDELTAQNNAMSTQIWQSTVSAGKKTGAGNGETAQE